MDPLFVKSMVLSAAKAGDFKAINQLLAQCNIGGGKEGDLLNSGANSNDGKRYEERLKVEQGQLHAYYEPIVRKLEDEKKAMAVEFAVKLEGETTTLKAKQQELLQEKSRLETEIKVGAEHAYQERKEWLTQQRALEANIEGCVEQIDMLESDNASLREEIERLAALHADDLASLGVLHDQQQQDLLLEHAADLLDRKENEALRKRQYVERLEQVEEKAEAAAQRFDLVQEAAAAMLQANNHMDRMLQALCEELTLSQEAEQVLLQEQDALKQDIEATKRWARKEMEDMKERALRWQADLVSNMRTTEEKAVALLQEAEQWRSVAGMRERELRETKEELRQLQLQLQLQLSPVMKRQDAKKAIGGGGGGGGGEQDFQPIVPVQSLYPLRVRENRVSNMNNNGLMSSHPPSAVFPSSPSAQSFLAPPVVDLSSTRQNSQISFDDDDDNDMNASPVAAVLLDTWRNQRHSSFPQFSSPLPSSSPPSSSFPLPSSSPSSSRNGGTSSPSRLHESHGPLSGLRAGGMGLLGQRTIEEQLHEQQYQPQQQQQQLQQQQQQLQQQLKQQQYQPQQQQQPQQQLQQQQQQQQPQQKIEAHSRSIDRQEEPPIAAGSSHKGGKENRMGGGGQGSNNNHQYLSLMESYAATASRKAAVLASSTSFSTTSSVSSPSASLRYLSPPPSLQQEPVGRWEVGR